MNNKIIKLQQGDYFKWNNLSREDKVKRNKQIAKQYLDKGPSIQNYYNALKAYFGGFNPKNPYLQTGEPIILPGMNPAKGIQTAATAARTLEDYLKTTKVTAQALEGSSAARSAYATDRYLGGVMFENNLPEAASQIQGHGMAKASTLQENLARLRYILDNGLEKGKTFFTAPLKVSDARIGSALGTGGGKPYFDGHFLITGKPGQMINSVDDIGTIYINDAYENEEALKAAQKMKEYLTKTYPNKVFKLYSEGFKKGGTIKTANARKWKHRFGGQIIKNQEGGKVDWTSIINNGLNTGIGIYSSILQKKAIDESIKAMEKQAELDKQKLFYQKQKELLGQQVDRSSIVNQKNAYEQAKASVDYSDINDQLLKQKQDLLNKKQEVDNQTFDYIQGFATSVLNSGILNKKSSTTNNNIINNNKSDNLLQSTSFYKPDSSNQVYTTKSGISNTVDDWRNLIIR